MENAHFGVHFLIAVKKEAQWVKALDRKPDPHRLNHPERGEDCTNHCKPTMKSVSKLAKGFLDFTTQRIKTVDLTEESME